MAYHNELHDIGNEIAKLQVRKRTLIVLDELSKNKMNLHISIRASYMYERPESELMINHASINVNDNHIDLSEDQILRIQDTLIKIIEEG